MEVDSLGLDEVDRKILMTIIENFNGGPVGINTIAAAIDEEKDTIESIYEPFLMRIGFLERTIRGRKVTPKAYAHLGFGGESQQKKLFKDWNTQFFPSKFCICLKENKSQKKQKL